MDQICNTKANCSWRMFAQVYWSVTVTVCVQHTTNLWMLLQMVTSFQWKTMVVISCCIALEKGFTLIKVLIMLDSRSTVCTGGLHM